MPTHETGTARLYRSIEPGSDSTMEATFELRPLNRDDHRHAFVFLADPQTGTSAEMETSQTETVPDVRQTAQLAHGTRLGVVERVVHSVSGTVFFLFY